MSVGATASGRSFFLVTDNFEELFGRSDIAALRHVIIPRIKRSDMFDA